MRLVEMIKGKGLDIIDKNEMYQKSIEPRIREITGAINKLSVYFPSATSTTKKHSVSKEKFEHSEQLLKMYAALHSQIGDVNHVGEWFIINQESVNQFSQLTGDDQWIHIDPIKALQCSPYKNTVVQGLFLISLIPKLGNFETLFKNQFPNSRFIVNRGLHNVAFLKPVKVGSKIRSENVLHRVELKKRYLKISYKITLKTGPVLKKVCTLEVELCVFA